MIGNKIVDKIAKVSEALPQNNWKKVEYETEDIGFDWERPKERYISPERGQKIVD